MLPGSACVSTIWDFDLLFKELGVQTGVMAYQLRVTTAQQKTQVWFSASTPGSSQLLVIPDVSILYGMGTHCHIPTYRMGYIQAIKKKEQHEKEKLGVGLPSSQDIHSLPSSQILYF